MKPQRLRTILQTPTTKRFSVMAEGMSKLAESVAARSATAADLSDKRDHQSAAVLRSFADEEAAKILILLDLARCGWNDEEPVKCCLFAFYNHLARGLYVEAYDGNPADLPEVRRYVDAARAEYYLDGPTDVDWIFNNWVLARREEALYVDYIEREDGTRTWTGPAELAAMFDEPFDYPRPPSVAVTLVAAMSRIGLLTEEGLTFTRVAWEGVSDVEGMHWSDLRPINLQVVAQLAEAGSILTDDAASVAYVLEHWIFPLSGLDLRMRKVKVKDLQDERDFRLAQDYL